MKEPEKRVPELRFKGFNDDWEQRKLKDFGKATGGTSIESEFVAGGKYKVISIGSYSEGSVYTDQNIRAELTDKTRNRVLNKDDLTMILNDKTASGNIIGRVLLIDTNDSYVYNQRTERIEPDHEKYDSQYLYHLLNAPLIRSKIIKQAQGNTQIYVNWSGIGELEYIVPKLDEQRKISVFFKQLDNTIALLQRKCDKLIQLKHIYLTKSFPHSHEIVPLFRHEGFYSEWKQKKLSEITERVQGNDGRMNLPILTISASKGWLDQRERFTTVIAGKEQQNYTLLTKGELAYNKGNSKIAKYGVVFELTNFEEALVPRVYHSFKPNDLAISCFIEKLFATKKTDRELAKLITSGARMDGLLNINYKDFSNIKLMVPEPAEQKKISSFIQCLELAIALLQTKIVKIKTLKKAYLQKMFV